MLNRFRVSVITVLAALLPTTLLAESVSYGGVEFPVDSISVVEGGNKKISLGEKSFLVPAADVGRKLAQVYSSDPNLFQKTFKLEQVSTLFTSLVAQNDPLAVPFLQTLFRTNVYLPTAAGELIASLSTTPAGASVIESAITSFDTQISSPQILCEAFTTLKAASKKMMQEKATRLIYRYQYQCTEYLQKRAQQTLTEGNLAVGIRYLDSISQLFADGGEAYLPLTTARNRLMKLETAINSADYLGVGRLVKTLAEDPWLSPFAVNLSRSIVQLAIDASLQEGRLNSALRLIPSIEFQRRTPRDHQLISKVLESVTPAERDALMSESVAQALGAFSRKDTAVYEAYLGALTKLAENACSGRNFQGVDSILQRIFAVRPDPSPENDALRRSVVESYLNAGFVREARTVAEEMSSSIPLLLRIKLLLAGAYVEVGVLSSLIVAVLLGFVFILWGRRARAPTKRIPKPRKEKKKTVAQPEDPEEDEDLERPRFVVYAHGVKLGRGVDEYEECLKIFDLKPGVSLQKIKVSYRNAVKTCHPDLNPNAGEEEATRFIQLTRTYEKLLHLHEQRTGER